MPHRFPNIKKPSKILSFILLLSIFLGIAIPQPAHAGGWGCAVGAVVGATAAFFGAALFVPTGGVSGVLTVGGVTTILAGCYGGSLITEGISGAKRPAVSGITSLLPAAGSVLTGVAF